MDNIFNAVYDFRILPYALGDILTWSIKSCIRAILLRKDKIDVSICVDPEFPSFLYQRKTINSENCQLFFLRLFPAFYFNPMLRNIYVFQSREKFIDHIKRSDDFLEYEKSIQNTEDCGSVYQTLQKFVSSHSEINLFYKNNGYTPKLIPPKGCINSAIKIKETFAKDKILVTIHFRVRKMNPDVGTLEIHRDSDFIQWYEFINRSNSLFPNVVFALLGELNEKDPRFFDLPNVIFPRKLGYGMVEELSLIHISSLFMGASSGCAAYATFSDVPYLMTKLHDQSFKSYCIQEGDLSFPFSSKDQILYYGDEDSGRFISHLNKLFDISQK